MKIILMVTLTMMLSSTLNAADKNVSKEERKKMADIHAKMSECLKSDKPMSECKNEMMKSGKDMMDMDGCPMMNKKGMDH